MTSAAEPPDMVCQELVELVTEYLEGSLDTATTARLEAHLSYCEPCVVYIEQMRATVRTLGAVPPPPIEPEFRDRLLTAFRGWSGSADEPQG